MEQAWNWVLAVVTLAAGLFLTIKPEKATWSSKPTKTNILIARITGIVILALLAFAGVAFLLAIKAGQITF